MVSHAGSLVPRFSGHADLKASSFLIHPSPVNQGEKVKFAALLLPPAVFWNEPSVDTYPMLGYAYGDQGWR